MTDEQETIKSAPSGWVVQSHSNTFSGIAGPYYFRKEGAIPGVGFFSEPRHANLGGIVHGGAMMTLADMALWDICRRSEGVFRGVTVTMNSEFVGAGPIGVFIEATGEMTKAGRSLMFARGLVTSDGKPLLSFSGTLKRLP